MIYLLQNNPFHLLGILFVKKNGIPLNFAIFFRAMEVVDKIAKKIKNCWQGSEFGL